MNREPDIRKSTTVESDDRAEQETIVHETIPGRDPIVTGEDHDAKKKGGQSTADEDI